MSSYVGVGVMSGTSLDGLDLCCVEFAGCLDNDIWSHRIISAEALPYDAGWTGKLRDANTLNGEDLAKLHIDYGHFLGKAIKKFIEQNETKVDFVAMHGHTVFHQPERAFTFQLGDGETTVAYLMQPLVSNFRAKDVALGGQGAPLVPMGERFLFSQCDLCLNLGGIANISVNGKGYDVSVCNMLLNYLSRKLGTALEFDENGKIAERGQVKAEVLQKLNKLSYYKLPPPKSLGKEWFDLNILPILDVKKYSVHDLLRTSVEHIAQQIVDTIETNTSPSTETNTTTEKSLLITGGGALNNFLISVLRAKLDKLKQKITFVQIDEETIQFKEALVFAFLGLRTLLGLPTVGSEVTGACSDSCTGSIHLPPFPGPLGHPGLQNFNFRFPKDAPKLMYTPPLYRKV